MAIQKESNITEEEFVFGTDGNWGVWEASILFGNLQAHEQ